MSALGPSPPTLTLPRISRCPPLSVGEMPRCHFSGSVCLAEVYHVRVQAGTALGEAGELQWDASELHRGVILLNGGHRQAPWAIWARGGEGWALGGSF